MDIDILRLIRHGEMEGNGRVASREIGEGTDDRRILV